MPYNKSMSGTLEINHISQSYGARKVLNDITFRLGDGTIACLLGASGCGKTTALRCIAGFERVVAGEIVINGQVASRPGYRLPPKRAASAWCFRITRYFRI